jgi:hypothetical protein
MQYALQTKRKEIQMTKFANDISQPKKSSILEYDASKIPTQACLI